MSKRNQEAVRAKLAFGNDEILSVTHNVMFICILYDVQVSNLKCFIILIDIWLKQLCLAGIMLLNSDAILHIVVGRNGELNDSHVHLLNILKRYLIRIQIYNRN